MSFFERYLTLWVLCCIGIGIGVGALFGAQVEVLSRWTLYQVNIPVTILIWLMIYPMMLQIDFTSLKQIGKAPNGIAWTVIINWAIKPFSMAFFAWLFFDHIYSAWLSPQMAQQYIAGAILLGAAPCTAMVFVWSYLSDGDPNYTLIQVSVNDIIILFAFIPLVGLLLGITNIEIPYNTLFVSVVAFVVIPLAGGFITHIILTRTKGEAWYKSIFLPKFKPVSVSALLITLILLFAYQGDRILAQPFHILMIALPLALQTYFIFAIAWYGGQLINLPYQVCAPGSMIGASNFFELAVAVAIALFGLQSGAALATVVGVLIEVPIMLSLVQFVNKRQYASVVSENRD